LSYATNTDLAAEFPALTANGGFTTTTKVTAAQVDEWCSRASNFIDSKIGGKYTVPVDSTASPKTFSLLKEICCWMVYPRVAGVVGLPTGDSKTSSGVAAKTIDFGKKAEDTLKEIQSGAMKLVDAPLATTADGVDSYTANNAPTLQPPTFTREDDSW
jgi:hypothetical protein